VSLPAAISGNPNELTAEALESLHCDFIPREPSTQRVWKGFSSDRARGCCGLDLTV
jgi:hypothetical protein